MSRIEQRFRALRKLQRKALIPYLMAGDPALAETVPLMHALVDAGADLIELGVPFSDPMADGPVIQAAGERALVQGVSLVQTIAAVARFRETDSDTPVLLMGYLNPVEAMGYQAFADNAAAAGVDGLLTVDLPPEESNGLCGALGPAGIDPVFLFAPTTSRERLRRIGNIARGFLYYVAVKGITGSGMLDPRQVGERLAAVQGLCQLPLGVGFGIATPEAAAAISRVADAVIVGSALVDAIHRCNEGPSGRIRAAAALISGMRLAMDQAAAA